MRLFPPVAVLSLLLPTSGASAQARRERVMEASSWVSADPGTADAEEVATPGLEQRLYAVPDTAIVIPAAWMERATLAARQERPGDEGRLLASVHAPVASASAAVWQRIPAPRGLSSWRLAILSEAASFLRPHFVGFPTGPETRVVVYGGSSDQPAAVVRSSREDVWGPIVEGPLLFIEVTTVEVTTARGTRPSLIVDQVSNGIPRARQDAADCNLDPACYSTWSPIRSGIGRLYFEEGHQGYLCSGALLTDRSHTGKPYFLTAHHCIAAQAVADTSIVFWNYHTPTCNGLVPSLGAVPTTSGSAVMATSDATDFTLLLLDGPPPPGTAFLGWTTQGQATGTPVTLLHHPAGGIERISFGSMLEPRGSMGPGFWSVGLTRGSVEGGSSGAPLFSPSQQVVGQLLGGSRNGACNDPGVVDEFGKFSVSWPRGLSRFLNQ